MVDLLHQVIDIGKAITELMLGLLVAFLRQLGELLVRKRHDVQQGSYLGVLEVERLQVYFHAIPMTAFLVFNLNRLQLLVLQRDFGQLLNFTRNEFLRGSGRGLRRLPDLSNWTSLCILLRE